MEYDKNNAKGLRKLKHRKTYVVIYIFPNEDPHTRDMRLINGTKEELHFIPWSAVFSPGYRFFLTTGSCVSEPPTRGFLCVRTRDTLNILLEWGNPLKKWPHFKQKIGHSLPYMNYLYKG